MTQADDALAQLQRLETDELARYCDAIQVTGEIDQEYIKQPPLPESGPKTPKPDPN